MPKLLLLLLYLLLPRWSTADIEGDSTALLSFLSSVPHSRRLVWNSSSTCSWTGVTCDENGSSVIYLRLPGRALRGSIPTNTLSNLSSLRVLSLRSNYLSGPLPDLSGLHLLRAIYLQRNKFSSTIPSSLSLLSQLQRIDLSNNSLSGAIPPFQLPNLRFFSVANNSLTGSIPTSLSHFDASSFLGNPGLCGRPLPPCDGQAPSSLPPTPLLPRKKGGLSRRSVIAIIAAASAAVLLFLLLLLACWQCRRRRKSRGESGGEPKSPDGVRRSTSGVGTVTTSSTGVPDKNRLVFFGDGSFGFDLEDLLRASAEVLGKGSTGTSYKAVLEDAATTVVVKRLRGVAASKRDFDAQMELLGKLRHRNLCPLRAYYFAKDEKLLVSDYLPGASLSASLHGAVGAGLSPLDWLTRLRVAVAAGRGLLHLHAEAGVVHGNLKASNVLLRLDPSDSVLTDFGLSSLFGSATTTAASSSRAAGYRAPEVVHTRRPTVKSDVYSYGVVLLELLTGKAPQYAAGEDGVDLPRWVQSVVREEWTAEVFDADLVRSGGDAAEEDMVQLLQVSLACVAAMPEARPEMTEVLRMVSEIAEKAAARETGLKPSSEEEQISKADSGFVSPTP